MMKPPTPRKLAAGDVAAVCIPANAAFPNSPDLPLVLMRRVWSEPPEDGARFFEALFSAHGWGRSWRNGVYAFHHYHSTAHEALGCYRGWAKVQLGGPGAQVYRIQAGDAVVIPAGVSHKNVGASRDFAVVGAYPAGAGPDMCYGRQSEWEAALKRIARAPRPKADPVYGRAGPLMRAWAK